jgi:succinyl-diaminopimelate desuccinylase
MPSATLELTKTLISQRSLTPDDAGCQKIISERLKQFKFHLEPMRFADVDNLWARHGTESPLVVFAGHTDVVPTGPLDAWTSDPFKPTIRGDLLYGRGAADMKSGLSAMIVGAENFLQKNPDFKGSIGFLITSDEEGPSINGTQKVMEALVKRNEMIDYCVVGEASSKDNLGDMIRVGRRGSLHGTLTVKGKQGHVAYPEPGANPIHSVALALHELANEKWDSGNDYFPPTTFQITNIHSGTGAANVVPGTLETLFNFRFSTAVTVEELQERVTKILQKHPLKFDLEWNLSGSPFLTKKGKLIEAARAAIKEITNLDPELSTGGGTSDGRFIAPSGAEVIELGPINASIHQVDEHINIKELDKLTLIYERVLEKIFL